MQNSIIDQLSAQTGILFDANQFLYRTYHILKVKSDKELTFGLLAYSFLSQIRTVLKDLQIVNAIPFLIWDSPSSRDSRTKLFPAYKGNRSATPDIIRTTRQLLQSALDPICPRLNISFPNIEADDIIGIYCDHFNDLFSKWVIVSRDEDLVQCVRDNVDYYNLYTKELHTKSTLEEKYNFTLDRIPVYKALVKDNSDNWKGIKGVGKVTALKWFAGNKTRIELITDIYENKLKTGEQRKDFLLGLKLCKIPVLDDITPVVDYLVRKMLNRGSRDWEKLYKVFEINDINKVTFQIGEIA